MAPLFLLYVSNLLQCAQIEVTDNLRVCCSKQKKRQLPAPHPDDWRLRSVISMALYQERTVNETVLNSLSYLGPPNTTGMKTLPVAGWKVITQSIGLHTVHSHAGVETPNAVIQTLDYNPYQPLSSASIGDCLSPWPLFRNEVDHHCCQLSQLTSCIDMSLCIDWFPLYTVERRLGQHRSNHKEYVKETC